MKLHNTAVVRPKTYSQFAALMLIALDEVASLCDLSRDHVYIVATGIHIVS